jgi:hypothetical protein
MNREDFETLNDPPKTAQIHSRSFLSEGGAPTRTLLYGYTCGRDTFHVYLKDGLIHRLVYRTAGDEMKIVEYDYFRAWDAYRLVPDKRVYPDSTSLLMARLLRDAGVDVPYLPFDDKRHDYLGDEHLKGLIREDMM